MCVLSDLVHPIIQQNSYGPYDVLHDEKLFSEGPILKLDIQYAHIITRMKLPIQYENLNDD